MVEDKLSCALHLSDVLAHLVGYDVGRLAAERPAAAGQAATALEALGISPGLLPDLVVELEQRTNERAALFNAIRTSGAATRN